MIYDTPQPVKETEESADMKHNLIKRNLQLCDYHNVYLKEILISIIFWHVLFKKKLKYLQAKKIFNFNYRNLLFYCIYQENLPSRYKYFSGTDKILTTFNDYVFHENKHKRASRADAFLTTSVQKCSMFIVKTGQWKWWLFNFFSSDLCCV